MSTQVSDRGDHYLVSQVIAPGRRKKMARAPVAVPKGDPALLLAEIEKQAERSRAEFGVDQGAGRPVV